MKRLNIALSGKQNDGRLCKYCKRCGVELGLYRIKTDQPFPMKQRDKATQQKPTVKKGNPHEP